MKIKKICWGIMFLALAAILIMNQLGIMVNVNIMQLIISVFMVAIVITSIKRLNFFGILFPTGIILSMYSKMLGIESITPKYMFLIMLFLSIGLTILTSNKKNKTREREENFEKIENFEDDESFNMSVNWGSTIKYVNSDNLKVANIDCKFGAAKVYFDKVQIKEEKLIINLNVSFAGVEIYIPKNWKLTNNVNTNLGGIEEKRYTEEQTTFEVLLKGNVSFAGVEIIYI